MSVRFSWACLVLLLGLGVSSEAEAWTDTHVRTLKAELEPAPDGRARVTLTLGVDVEGGWLERLDLPGLDEELEVDPSEGAWVTTADGTRLPASVRAKDGELQVRFERSGAPRRGRHLLTVVYETVLLGRGSQSLGNGLVRLRHALPGWESGLTEAEVAWLVPRGSLAVQDAGVAQELRSEPAADGRRRLRFVRAHVPRSSPWAVAVDVPASFFGGALPGRAPSEPPGAPGAFTGLLLAVGLLVWSSLWRAVRRAQARREGLLPRSLVPTRPRRVARALLALGAALSWFLSPAAAALALTATALTFLDRFEARELPGLGRFVPLTRTDLRRAARTRWLRTLATTFALGSCLVGFVALRLQLPEAFELARNPWGLAVAVGFVPVLMAAHFLGPRHVSEQVGVLAAVAGRLVTVGTALRLFWYTSSEGTTREPRLRVIPFARYPGLLRVELSVDTRRGPPALVLMVVVEADSAADGWLRGESFVMARELSPGGLRAVHLARAPDPTENLDALFARLSRGSQRAWSAQAEAAAEAA